MEGGKQEKKRKRKEEGREDEREEEGKKAAQKKKMSKGQEQYPKERKSEWATRKWKTQDLTNDNQRTINWNQTDYEK